MRQRVTFLAEYGLYLGIPLVFLLIVTWIFRPSAKKRYETEGTSLSTNMRNNKKCLAGRLLADDLFAQAHALLLARYYASKLSLEVPWRNIVC